MSQVKVKRNMFRYPKDMPVGDKRNISVRSGYLASASLRDEHKQVYRNLLRKYSFDGLKNTTRSAMSELGRRYPERYQSLRVEIQEELVKEWSLGTSKGKMESPYCDPLKDPMEQKSRGGFLRRLFRSGF